MKNVLAVAMVVLMCVSVSFAQEKYPSRDITDVVVWGAGGGTDVCNRIVAGEMAKILGVNINVVNKTGGVGGSIGMLEALNAPADGYTIAGISESCVTAGVQGGWDKRMDVWDYFIVGGSPDLVSVTPDAPYQTIKDLLEAAKAKPGDVKACASAAGSIHHLNLLALEKGSGAKFNYIPYPGSAPCQNAAMTGEVTVVITSAGEQKELLRGKKLRPLGMLIPESFEMADVGVVPSAFPDYPDMSKYLPLYQAIGMGINADAPKDAKDVLADAFQKALETETVKTWAKENYYVLSGKTGKDAKDQFLKLESLFAWTLWDLGAAKVDPATLNIPKP